MSFEYGIVLRNLRLGRNGLLADVEVENTVDQLEIFEVHGGRLRALGRDQFVDASAQVFQDEDPLGGRLAIVDFLGPFFQRQFDSERLVDSERDIKKIEAVD